MTPEQRRRYVAAEHVAYTASRLAESLIAIQVRTGNLEERVRTAARAGMPRAEAEAMTKDLGFEVAAMVRRVYLGDDKYEVTGQDTVMYCLAHRRKVTWLSFGWWIHDDGRPSTGNPVDPRGCSAMWEAPAPGEVKRRTA